MSLLPAWRKVGQSIAALTLLGIGFVVGSVLRDSPLHADVREGKQVSSFKTGAQRSELKLAEISTTLRQIDGRLERLEKLAHQVVQRNSGPIPREEPRR